MRIAITGTPCVGKTTVSQLLSRKLKYRLIKINDLAEKLNAYVGYDKKRQSKILDMTKLKKEVRKIKGNIILDGHVSHEFPVDVVIILRCDPSVLKKRLEKKYPDNPFKVKENVDVEILGVITSEAVQNNQNVYEINITDRKPEEVVQIIQKILGFKTKEYRAGDVDWLDKGFVPK